ncbi:MAG TPA: HlyD family efflux transporter periplasmic adaptor subunit [Myxococcales bacterium]|nr:HlyD family efflux transporter periplasmic adaptor subunit [Myxococcales bacterium]
MRIAVALVLFAGALAGLLALRIHVQAAAARAAPGGSGEIEGTRIDLSARITARVASLHVREGDEAPEGTLVLELDCSDAEAALGEAEARLAAAMAQFEAAQAAAASACTAHDASLASRDAARAQEAALMTQSASADREAARLDVLGAEATAQSRDLAHSAADALRHQRRVARAQAVAAEMQAAAAGLQEGSAAAQAVAAESAANAARATLARARLLAGECEVRAPRTALVDDLPHQPGELVAAGQVLARLVDIDRVKAVFYLPNAELGAARTGARAVVVADAWPQEHFEGVVNTVSAQAEFTPRNIQTRSDRDRLVYEVEVWLDNPGHRLRPGMPVQVALPP